MRRRRQQGFTVVELSVVCAMIAILTAMAIPVAKYSIKRQNEMELKYDLRLLRDAIDKYKQYSDTGQIQVQIGSEGYPPDLKTLVDGVALVGQLNKKQKFLRRIPIDPMTKKTEWGHAVVPGRARLHVLGRPERLRRLLAVGRPRDRRDVLQGLVMRRSRQSGFTLLELLVVMTIIGILAAIAVPALRDSPKRAREATLKEDLFTLRSVIDQYHGDKGVFPPDIQTLVTDGYIRKIPVDPMTKSAETWVVAMEEAPPEDQTSSTSTPTEPTTPGIVDIHSGSPDKGLDGTSYKDW